MIFIVFQLFWTLLWHKLHYAFWSTSRKTKFCAYFRCSNRDFFKFPNDAVQLSAACNGFTRVDPGLRPGPALRQSILMSPLTLPNCPFLRAKSKLMFIHSFYTRTSRKRCSLELVLCAVDTKAILFFSRCVDVTPGITFECWAIFKVPVPI